MTIRKCEKDFAHYCGNCGANIPVLHCPCPRCGYEHPNH